MAELDAIRRGYPHLRVGQTIDEVRGILGAPTSEQPLYSKSNRTAPSGTALKYVVTAHGQGPNINDVQMLIVFDPDGRLTWAHPQNIEGLSEIGSR